MRNPALSCSAPDPILPSLPYTTFFSVSSNLPTYWYIKCKNIHPSIDHLCTKIFTLKMFPLQVNHESSAAPSSSNFSRPARPANQRRPSRWATHTPSSKITHTSCPSSPGLKAKQFLNSYSRHTETVIM